MVKVFLSSLPNLGGIVLFKVTTTSPQETLSLGKTLGKLLLPGDFLNLRGDLGAGKTLLVKGIGVGLGLTAEEVTSPTFAIINEYNGDYPLYHFDLYRLETDLELEQIGYLDYFYGSGITLVEWGQLFVHHLPTERLDLILEVVGPEAREITFIPQGERSAEIVEQLRGLY